jgi:hypothetical protein
VLEHDEDHEPAGTGDRPALPPNELPADLVAALEDRQRRLPFSRVHKKWQWYGLSHNESRAARRIVDARGLSDDVRYSLLHYHWDAVNRLAADAIPELSAGSAGWAIGKRVCATAGSA